MLLFRERAVSDDRVGFETAKPCAGCWTSFLDRCHFSHTRCPRMLSFDYCPTQGSGVLFVRVPETNQHEKHKAGNRKEGQRKQNTANHWCPLFCYPLPSIVKNAAPRHTSPAACACRCSQRSCCSAGSTARELNATIADHWSGASTMERPRLSLSTLSM